MERIWIGHECSLVPWNEVNMSRYRAPFQGWQHDSLGMRLAEGMNIRDLQTLSKYGLKR